MNCTPSPNYTIHAKQLDLISPVDDTEPRLYGDWDSPGPRPISNWTACEFSLSDILKTPTQYDEQRLKQGKESRRARARRGSSKHHTSPRTAHELSRKISLLEAISPGTQRKSLSAHPAEAIAKRHESAFRMP